MGGTWTAPNPIQQWWEDPAVAELKNPEDHLQGRNITHRHTHTHTLLLESGWRTSTAHRLNCTSYGGYGAQKTANPYDALLTRPFRWKRVMRRCGNHIAFSKHWQGLGVAVLCSSLIFQSFVFPTIHRHDLFGTAIDADQLTPQTTTPGLIGSPMAVPNRSCLGI